MNTRELAEKYFEQISNTNQIKMTRIFSKMVQGDSFVLNYLYTHDCQAYPTEICSAMAVTSARIAKILADMKAKDLVARVHSPYDGRHIMVVLTNKGISRVEEMRENVLSDIEQTFSVLDQQDIEDLIRIRNKLTNAMEEKNIIV
jgi:DNA-binding MarR family transcriptional regulator